MRKILVLAGIMMLCCTMAFATDSGGAFRMGTSINDISMDGTLKASENRLMFGTSADLLLIKPFGFFLGIDWDFMSFSPAFSTQEIKVFPQLLTMHTYGGLYSGIKLGRGLDLNFRAGVNVGMSFSSTLSYNITTSIYSFMGAVEIQVTGDERRGIRLGADYLYTFAGNMIYESKTYGTKSSRGFSVSGHSVRPYIAFVY